MAADLFGGRRFASIYGVLNLGNGLGGAIGPWLGGFVHDLTGSYRLAFLAPISFCGLAPACFWPGRAGAPPTPPEPRRFRASWTGLES